MDLWWDLYDPTIRVIHVDIGTARRITCIPRNLETDMLSLDAVEIFLMVVVGVCLVIECL